MGCFGHVYALERSRKRRVTSGGSRCERVLEARQVNKKLNRKLSLNREIYTPPPPRIYARHFCLYADTDSADVAGTSHTRIDLCLYGFMS
jgi:hypothetical protein